MPVFPKLFFPAGDATSALLQLRDHSGALVRGTMMALDLALMGHTYGPLDAVLDEQFPTAVRYTGASLAFNLAGIFGASLAPYIATWGPIAACAADAAGLVGCAGNHA